MISETSKDVPFAPSKLDKETQFLVDLIFKKDMFNHALSQLKLGMCTRHLSTIILNDRHQETPSGKA